MFVLFVPAVAEVELGFHDYYHGVNEGSNGHFYVLAYGDTPSNDVVLRLIPLTVSGFQNYSNAHPERTFGYYDNFYYIEYINDPAECEH